MKKCSRFTRERMVREREDEGKCNFVDTKKKCAEQRWNVKWFSRDFASIFIQSWSKHIDDSAIFDSIMFLSKRGVIFSLNFWQTLITFFFKTQRSSWTRSWLFVSLFVYNRPIIGSSIQQCSVGFSVFLCVVPSSQCFQVANSDRVLLDIWPIAFARWPCFECCVLDCVYVYRYYTKCMSVDIERTHNGTLSIWSLWFSM